MPGTSAILTPFCKTDGLYFDGSHEPESFKFEFDKEIDNYYGHRKGYLNISPNLKSIEDYYDFNLHAFELSKDISSKKIRRRVDVDDDMYVIDINI